MCSSLGQGKLNDVDIMLSIITYPEMIHAVKITRLFKKIKILRAVSDLQKLSRK
jgi:hypothetical protein